MGFGPRLPGIHMAITILPNGKQMGGGQMGLQKGTLETTDMARFRQGLLGDLGQTHNLYLTLLGLPRLDTAHLIKRVERGFSFSLLVRFQRNVALPMKEIAEWVQIPQTTLNRRRLQGRLQPAESDRVLRASRVFGKALELFEGDADAARHWLVSPQRALGGAVPMSLAKTNLGAREVEDLIERLEHGVFS
jgi:putative toxin-antitoxin system antitoxin component (TIGR02293 family)